MKALSEEEYARRWGDAPVEGAAVFEAEAADYALPRRQRRSHKYSYGRALVLAGSRGYTGAPLLAARACERSGAGLTQLLVPESIYTVAALGCEGAVVTPLPATAEGRTAAGALAELRPLLPRAQACAAGPGLGTGPDAKELVAALLAEAPCPLVLDADALTVLAGEPERLDGRTAPLLLTPHEGEFQRLGGDLSRGRLRGALDFTRRHPGVLLVLKGPGTLIVRGDRVLVNPTGGPAMAKGGSGDVLTGILCGLIAQGFDPWFAAGCGVWLHGESGDLAAAELGEYSLTPGDLIAYLPRAFRRLQPPSEN